MSYELWAVSYGRFTIYNLQWILITTLLHHYITIAHNSQLAAQSKKITSFKTNISFVCYIDKRVQKPKAKSQRLKDNWWFGLQSRFIAAGGVTKTSPAHPQIRQSLIVPIQLWAVTMSYEVMKLWSNVVMWFYLYTKMLYPKSVDFQLKAQSSELTAI